MQQAGFLISVNSAVRTAVGTAVKTAVETAVRTAVETAAGVCQLKRTAVGGLPLAVCR